MQAFRANYFAWFMIAVKVAKPVLAMLVKALSAAVKLLKGAGAAKLGFGAASFGAYAVLADWRFACSVLACIGIHESGHVWAMRRMGMQTRGFYFIPFLGGVAVQESQFPSAWAEGYVALMGPIWGLFTTAAAYALFLATGNVAFEVAACWMAFVNLLNCIPVYPLDGGRVARSLAQSVEGLGATLTTIGLSVAGIAFCAVAGYWLFAFFGIMGITDEWVNRTKRHREGVRWQEDRPQLDAFLQQLARALDLPEHATWEEIVRALRVFRKDPAWREDLDRIAALRAEYAERRRSWERLIRRWRKRYRKSFVGVDLSLPLDRRWQSEFDGVPDDVIAEFLARVDEDRAFIAVADAEFARVEERMRARLRAHGVPPGREANPLDATAGVPVAGASRWKLLALPFFGHPTYEEFVQYPYFPLDTYVGMLSRKWWFSAPAFTLLVLAADPKARAVFGEQYGYSRMTAEWRMTARQTFAVIGTYMLLAATLFLLMTGTGGHDAAMHAVEFFRAF